MVSRRASAGRWAPGASLVASVSPSAAAKPDARRSSGRFTARATSASVPALPAAVSHRRQPRPSPSASARAPAPKTAAIRASPGPSPGLSSGGVLDPATEFAALRIAGRPPGLRAARGARRLGPRHGRPSGRHRLRRERRPASSATAGRAPLDGAPVATSSRKEPSHVRPRPPPPSSTRARRAPPSSPAPSPRSASTSSAGSSPPARRLRPLPRRQARSRPADRPVARGADGDRGQGDLGPRPRTRAARADGARPLPAGLPARRPARGRGAGPRAPAGHRAGYGAALLVFALHVVAHPAAGNPAFLGRGGITWVALWGHVLLGAIVAAVVRHREGPRVRAHAPERSGAGLRDPDALARPRNGSASGARRARSPREIAGARR